MSYAIYAQRTGAFTICEIEDGGVDRVLYECQGHSGNGRCRDNPTCQEVRAKGPLPVGFYRVHQKPHHRFHAPAFLLEPYSTNIMFGRSGFWIHGGIRSLGCILLDRRHREAVEHFEVKYLEVVAPNEGSRHRMGAVYRAARALDAVERGNWDFGDITALRQALSLARRLS